MFTLCIRYTLDANKLKAFQSYAERWPQPIQRCGGELVGYFLPTKLAGPTNIAYALINFPDLAAYERYREALMKDPDAISNTAAADAAGCIVIEDRSFLRKA